MGDKCKQSPSLSLLINSGSSQLTVIYCRPLCSEGSDRVCCHFNLSLAKFYFPRHNDRVSACKINTENGDGRADRWRAAATIAALMSTVSTFSIPGKALFKEHLTSEQSQIPLRVEIFVLLFHFKIFSELRKTENDVQWASCLFNGHT